MIWDAIGISFAVYGPDDIERLAYLAEQTGGVDLDVEPMFTGHEWPQVARITGPPKQIDRAWALLFIEVCPMGDARLL